MGRVEKRRRWRAAAVPLRRAVTIIIAAVRGEGKANHPKGTDPRAVEHSLLSRGAPHGGPRGQRARGAHGCAVPSIATRAMRSARAAAGAWRWRRRRGVTLSKLVRRLTMIISNQSLR